MQLRNGSSKARTISAGVAGLAGLIFFVVGVVVDRSGDPMEGGLLVDGQVVATPPSDSDGDACTKVVRYVVDDIAYEARTSIGTSWGCDDFGQTMQVSYLADDPSTAKVVDSAVGWIGLILKLVGGAVLVVSALLVVRLVRQVTAPDTPNLGPPGTGVPAVRLSDLTFTGPSPAVPVPAGTTPSTTPPPLPPPAVAPPPGWYLDPDDADGAPRQRWWDGRVWTEHRR